MRATLKKQAAGGSPTPEVAAGHARRRRDAMLRVQQVALDLFEQRGFAAVGVEEIARAAGVGPATVYRHFGSKERIVLWDDYDPLLLEAVERELPGRPVVEAVRRALTSALSRFYRDEGAHILRRTRLARSIPSVMRESEADQRQLRAALAATLRRSGRARSDLEANVLAGALGAALLAGIESWLDGDGRQPLGRCLSRAFRCLGAIGDRPRP